jgi:flagellar biogenesis protein FliO
MTARKIIWSAFVVSLTFFLITAFPLISSAQQDNAGFTPQNQSSGQLEIVEHDLQAGTGTDAQTSNQAQGQTQGQTPGQTPGQNASTPSQPDLSANQPLTQNQFAPNSSANDAGSRAPNAPSLGGDLTSGLFDSSLGIVKAIGAFVLVIALLLICLKIIGWLGRGRRSLKGNRAFTLRGTMALDAKRYLAAVEIDGHLLVVGVTADRLTALANWPLAEDEELDFDNEMFKNVSPSQGPTQGPTKGPRATAPSKIPAKPSVKTAAGALKDVYPKVSVADDPQEKSFQSGKTAVDGPLRNGPAVNGLDSDGFDADGLDGDGLDGPAVNKLSVKELRSV